ncbi:MAG: hypothetical protein KDB69_03905, partial [Acidimicrobiia bacterium]|nr:hypothetical protein [Acidimicrobiia bacterium]
MELACQVVPDIPTFAVDDGFTYAIPEGMTVSVGSIVRVRVSGRRRRGFVTAIFPRPDGRRLLDVDGVSGSAPTFDEHLLESARRVAEHYVAPLSNVLGRTVPPNVPRRSRRSTAPVRSTEPGPVMVTGSWAPHHRAVMDALERSGPRPIVVPTDVEAQALADALATAEEPVGRVLTASSAQSNAATTAAWVSASQDTDTVMVGTRETMLWASAAKRGWIVVEDGRRVMKSPATPTLQVRDVLLERLRNEGGTLDVIGPVPTLEVMAVADVTTIPPGRSWSPVEIVDRT